MVKWYENTIATLDFETTGLDVLQDRVIQVGFLILDGQSNVRDGSWEGLINPGVSIPREASEIHGITTKMVKAEGHEPATVFADLASVIDGLVDSQIPLVIFNAPFDWPFLLAETATHRIETPRMPWIIDPFTIDRAVDKYRRGSRKLEAMAAHYNIDFDNAHDAVADSRASIEIAKQIATLHSSIGNADFEDLHRRQAKWYDDWANNYADYLRRNGKDSSTVDTGWPINKRHQKELM